MANKKCQTCKFRTKYSGMGLKNCGKKTGKTDIGCAYILITGHIRGCAGGDSCTKYERGEAQSFQLEETEETAEIPEM